jgi:hypothetical protein
MNSKKLSKKLDRTTDKICKYLSPNGETAPWDQTCLDVSFFREKKEGKWGYGTLGKWKVVVGSGSNSKEFTGKSLNSALRYCLKHYKEEYQKNLLAPVV